MNERAVEIAQKHIQQANPSLWNGSSERQKILTAASLHTPLMGVPSWTSALSMKRKMDGCTFANCGTAIPVNC